jgi:hypothetical protein
MIKSGEKCSLEKRDSVWEFIRRAQRGNRLSRRWILPPMPLLAGEKQMDREGGTLKARTPHAANRP